MKRSKWTIGMITAVVGLMLAAGLSAHGAELYVASTGDDSDGSTWNAAYTNLQTAIDAASNNDTIYIKAETLYTDRVSANEGQFLWVNKPLTILSAAMPPMARCQARSPTNPPSCQTTACRQQHR